MKDFVVQNVAFSYSPTEDRLKLLCTLENETFEAWMSRRMLQQLLPALVKWLGKSGIGDSQSTDFIRQSLQQSRLNKPQQSSGTALSNTPSDMVSDDGEVPSEIHGESASKMESNSVWLCFKANITMSDSRIRIQLEDQYDPQVLVLSMTVLEASHFLLAQCEVLKNAGWALDWPDWMSLDDELSVEPTAHFLH